MLNAANTAVQHHVHWKNELARLEPRLGRSQAIVAIAHKLRVAVWHVLRKAQADRYADPQDVARSLFAHAYKLGVKNLPKQPSALAFTRDQLDRLRLGKDLKEISWGSQPHKLPPSKRLLEKE